MPVTSKWGNRLHGSEAAPRYTSERGATPRGVVIPLTLVWVSCEIRPQASKKIPPTPRSDFGWKGVAASFPGFSVYITACLEMVQKGGYYCVDHPMDRERDANMSFGVFRYPSALVSSISPVVTTSRVTSAGTSFLSTVRPRLTGGTPRLDEEGLESLLSLMLCDVLPSVDALVSRVVSQKACPADSTASYAW